MVFHTIALFFAKERDFQKCIIGVFRIYTEDIEDRVMV